MVFTSPSVANKGNVFHILSPRSTIYVVMQEWVTFNLLEKVEMAVSAWPISNEYQVNGELSMEVISVDRVLESLYERSDNYLEVFIQDIPKKIVACKAKNLTLTQRFFPDPFGAHNFAIVIYNYEVEFTYLNSTDNVKQVSFNSGTRRESTFVRTPRGRLNVSIDTTCIYNKITKYDGVNNTAYITGTPKFKSKRLFLEAKMKN